VSELEGRRELSIVEPVGRPRVGAEATVVELETARIYQGRGPVCPRSVVLDYPKRCANAPRVPARRAAGRDGGSSPTTANRDPLRDVGARADSGGDEPARRCGRPRGSRAKAARCEPEKSEYLGVRPRRPGGPARPVGPLYAEQLRLGGRGGRRNFVISETNDYLGRR